MYECEKIPFCFVLDFLFNWKSILLISIVQQYPSLINSFWQAISCPVKRYLGFMKKKTCSPLFLTVKKWINHTLSQVRIIHTSPRNLLISWKFWSILMWNWLLFLLLACERKVLHLAAEIFCPCEMSSLAPVTHVLTICLVLVSDDDTTYNWLLRHWFICN